MPTSIRLPKQTEERLQRLSDSTGRPKAFYLRQAIEQSLTQLEWEYDLLQRVSDVRSGKAETCSLDEMRKHLGLAN